MIKCTTPLTNFTKYMAINNNLLVKSSSHKFLKGKTFFFQNYFKTNVTFASFDFQSVLFIWMRINAWMVMRVGWWCGQLTLDHLLSSGWGAAKIAPCFFLTSSTLPAIFSIIPRISSTWKTQKETPIFIICLYYIYFAIQGYTVHLLGHSKNLSTK